MISNIDFYNNCKSLVITSCWLYSIYLTDCLTQTFFFKLVPGLELAYSYYRTFSIDIVLRNTYYYYVNVGLLERDILHITSSQTFSPLSMLLVWALGFRSTKLEV